MEDLSVGFRLLRNALILALVAFIIPIVALGFLGKSDIASITFDQFNEALSSNPHIIALSMIVGLISLLFMYKGWMEVCYGLDEIFCKVGRVIKYGTLISIALLLVAIGVSYPSVEGMGNFLGSITTSPTASVLQSFSSLAMLVVLLSNVYAFYKLGVLLELNNLRIGAIFLVIGPISAFLNIVAIYMGLTLLGLILLTLSMNKLISAEIEVVEEQERYGEEEYGEVWYKGSKPKPKPKSKPRTEETYPKEESPFLYDELEISHPKRHHPSIGREPVERSIEEVARLVGPNGFEVKLNPGIRTFGRRDFVGYVSDEDLDYISRRHFEIRGTSKGYFIRDLGSLNGTWVDGRKLERGESVKLVNGAMIDVAEVVRLKFVYKEPENLGVASL